MKTNLEIMQFRWGRKWPNKETIYNKNFKELVIYKGVPLWWFVDVWLYYLPMSNIFYLIEY